jgi:hypothetical protein
MRLARQVFVGVVAIRRRIVGNAVTAKCIYSQEIALTNGPSVGGLHFCKVGMNAYAGLNLQPNRKKC